jgi:pSer/pThr/pTyr-binding forkhead associated (FHA) protein
MVEDRGFKPEAEVPISFAPMGSRQTTSRSTREKSRGTQTDTGQRAPRAQARQLHRHLFLLLESDRIVDGGARYSLQRASEVLIGRGDERDVSYRNGRAAVDVRVTNVRASAKHCRITCGPSGLVVEDLGSKNGTFVNGARLGGRSALHAGDVLQVGRAFFTYRETHAGADPHLDEPVDSEALAQRSLPGFPTLLPDLEWRLRRLRPAIESGDAISIVGETGTGKEMLARAIHEASRPKKPFVPVNCGALAPNLVEGQLFGYTRGAYSGAERSDPGFVRLADGGTLLLDEVLDLPMAMQAKLLRVLQESEVVALGTARGTRVDVRFISASQRLLADVAAGGAFRADLAARLDRHVLTLPPLRERREDLGLLAAAILRRYGAKVDTPLSLPAKSVYPLLRYRWLGNIRELENALVRAFRFAVDGVLDVETLPKEEPTAEDVRPHLSDDDQKLREALLASLQTHHGNIAEVARAMGAHRQQVYRWLRRLGVHPGEQRRNRR